MVSKNSEARKCVNTNRASIEESIAGKIDMNSVMKSELNFHGIILTPVSELSGIWLTASQIGYALKYADDKAVQRIYSRHLDEFTEYMTKVVNVTTPGGTQQTRVFSLRGAHLIAMFARTPVAKEFRRWILDILDREVGDTPEVSPLYRYSTKVIIRDNVMGGEVEFELGAETLTSLATGIPTCLGLAPTGFSKTEVRKDLIRKIH